METQEIDKEQIRLVRDYFKERNYRREELWKRIQATQFKEENDEEDEQDFSFSYLEIHDIDELLKTSKEYQHNFAQEKFALIHENILKGEDYQFYKRIEPTEIPENRQPNEGIRVLNAKFHTSNPVIATEDMPETGHRPAKVIEMLIDNYYPKYRNYLDAYIRPLGTTDATFNDFNRAQIPSQELTKEEIDLILPIVLEILGVRPYKPVHYDHTIYAGMPLSTGTGYHNRQSYNYRVHSKYTSPPEYKHKYTSKGHYFNTVFPIYKSIIHNFKHHGSPVSKADIPEEIRKRELFRFIINHPTMIFTRNHISKQEGPWKQRPVYAVDDCFLRAEVMLGLPLLCQARKMTSCIMYSLETIRGGCHYLDNLAKNYKSFFTIDWSSFDQSLPRVVTDLFFTELLPRSIVINKGYAKSHFYTGPIDPDFEPMYKKTRNLIYTLHTWFNNMVFVTADGYAYQRTCAGVPSGQFLTQYMDSFGNLFIMIHGMLKFGFTVKEIRDMRFFIMGDDNSAFTRQQIARLSSFITYFESYAKKRWNMTLSKAKSVITGLRNKIELLSYQCNFGMPIRPLPKLVAQLCLPEHGLKPKYMSYRAIGIAYAAAGMDPHFHAFCRDVYIAFYRDKADLTDEVKNKIIKHIPGIFKTIDNYAEVVDLTTFPTLHEVRETYSSWKGELDYSPKWDPACFAEPPFCTTDDYLTIADYERLHNITPPKVESFNANDFLHK